jgi:hypothetical protein
MTPAWAQRQEELLRDCIVSPDVFTPMVDRLRDAWCPSSSRKIRGTIADHANKLSSHFYGLGAHLSAANFRWCPSIAWMKGRRSDVNRSLVEPGVQGTWHAIAQQYFPGPHSVRHTCYHARRDGWRCLGAPAL